MAPLCLCGVLAYLPPGRESDERFPQREPSEARSSSWVQDANAWLTDAAAKSARTSSLIVFMFFLVARSELG